ncbi:MAG: hypothetical protein HC850_00790 [Rhodomicrobium sp.]|nr:hypothetical protein [Rhodomicrobium sp.]
MTEQKAMLSCSSAAESADWSGKLMDTITTSILKEFSDSHQLNHLKEDSRFEHFCAFVTLRRHHARTFDTTDIVVGKGGDTGIDSISIIVNGALITDIDEIEELATRNGYLEANFIFSQAERSSSFDGSKIGSFGFGVEDFFKSEPSLPRNPKIVEASAIIQAIFKRGNLIRTKPTCRLYYVTTGKWVEDKALNARKAASIAALEATQLFSSVEFTCYGADEIHQLYNQTKTAITRDFVFKERTGLPKLPVSSKHS